MKQNVLEISGLKHRLFDPDRGEEFTVFVEDKVSILEGDFVALLGPSGCGKTTLLTILGLLRKPTHLDELECFDVTVRSASGEPLNYDLKEAWLQGTGDEIERFRRQHLGFALQSGELLAALTVWENIAVPLRLNEWSQDSCEKRIRYLLNAFGLQEQSHQAIDSIDGKETPVGVDEPSESQRAVAPESEVASGESARLLDSARANTLSGGEYQRVALARAIAHEPTVVFVDEPTAALNRELARGALQQLSLLQQGEGRFGATIMITHDEQLADEFANVIVRMEPMPNRPAGRVREVIRTKDNSGAALDDSDSARPLENLAPKS